MPTRSGAVGAVGVLSDAVPLPLPQVRCPAHSGPPSRRVPARQAVHVRRVVSGGLVPEAARAQAHELPLRRLLVDRGAQRPAPARVTWLLDTC